MSIVRFLLSGDVVDFLVQPTFYTRFKNNGNYCWANSIIQALASLPPITEFLNHKDRRRHSINLSHYIRLASQTFNTYQQAVNVSKTNIFPLDTIADEIEKFTGAQLESPMDFLNKLFISSGTDHPVISNFFRFFCPKQTSIRDETVNLPETNFESIIENHDNGYFVTLFPALVEKTSSSVQLSNIFTLQTVQLTNEDNVYIIIQIYIPPKILCIEIHFDPFHPVVNRKTIIIEEELKIKNTGSIEIHPIYNLYAIVCFEFERQHYVSYCKRNNTWLFFDDHVQPVTPDFSLTQLDMEPFHNKNSICRILPNFQKVEEAIRNKPMILFYVQKE